MKRWQACFLIMRTKMIHLPSTLFSISKSVIIVNRFHIKTLKQNNRSHFLWDVWLCSCFQYFIPSVQFTGPNATTAQSLKDNGVILVRDVRIRKRSVTEVWAFFSWWDSDISVFEEWKISTVLQNIWIIARDKNRIIWCVQVLQGH